MANKTVKTRIVNKHDIGSNWAKAVNFIPKKGEIIIYDDVHRIKIGNGIDKVSGLPFAESALDTSLSSHINNKENPHAVTKSQVGLGSVVNAGQTSAPTNGSNLYFTADGAYDLQTQINEAEKTAQEAYLTWGGKNFSGSYSPLDASMIPTLGANRLAMGTSYVSGVTVEYSRDGGSSWTNYSNVSDSNKAAIFNGAGATLYIGGDSSKGIDKSQYMVRFTLNTSTCNIYSVLNKFALYISTNGSTGSYCTIQARTKANFDANNDTWTTIANKIPISGWSGWNIINTSDFTTYGNQTSHYINVRFIFGVTSHASTVNYAGLTINKILGFGGVGWTTPSNLALNGEVYKWNADLSVKFPKSLYVDANDKCSGTGKLVATQEWVSSQISGVEEFLYEDLGTI